MTDLPTQRKTSQLSHRSSPPGKIKLAEALQTLLEGKDFSSITTSEIAKVAGVNEALSRSFWGAWNTSSCPPSSLTGGSTRIPARTPSATSF
jgi:hypothetical protein